MYANDLKIGEVLPLCVLLFVSPDSVLLCLFALPLSLWTAFYDPGVF